MGWRRFPAGGAEGRSGGAFYATVRTSLCVMGTVAFEHKNNVICSEWGTGWSGHRWAYEAAQHSRWVQGWQWRR